MKSPLGGCLVVLFAFSLSAWAQYSRMGWSPPAPPDSTQPTHLSSAGMNVNGSGTVIFVSGKVVLEDGGELTEPVAIQTVCKGQQRTETFSDRRGNFSFQLGDPNAATSNDASNGVMGARLNLAARRDSRDCQLEAVLAGFSSKHVELSDRPSQLDNIDIGKILLHRLEHVDGTGITVTSLLAPPAARKALEKAREREKAGQWGDAQKFLEKAVQIYPRYAVAWCELGRVQLHNRDLPAAERSFNQAVSADGKYVDPYDGLAQVAVQARDWRSVIEITDKLLTLNPVNFPDAYFFNAAAHYYLKNFDMAEKSALQGVRVDEDHQVPKLQYLLAIILLEKRDYRAAEQHIRLYLGMVTQPAEIETGRKTLAEITESSAAVESAAVAEKK
jgi:tetratricopeptide (TPR) repeat protein